jgi:hypothetical protein
MNPKQKIKESIKNMSLTERLAWLSDKSQLVSIESDKLDDNYNAVAKVGLDVIKKSIDMVYHEEFGMKPYTDARGGVR